MGNRIHTVLGYGLKNASGKNKSLFSDEFLDKLYSYEDDLLERLKTVHEKYSKECVDYQTRDSFAIRDFSARLECVGWYKDDQPIKKLYHSDFVKYSGYFSESKNSTMIFTDPFEKSWYRYDNLLDYYIFSDKKGPKDTTKILTNDVGESINIYPNSGFVNKKTGNVVKCHPYERWGRDYSEQEVLQKYGLTLKEWKDDVVPEVPYLIRLFCESENVFKNPLDVYQLKSMVATYWC